MKKQEKRIGYGKKVLSILLVMLMLVGLCPQVVFAATDVTLTFKSGATQDGEGRYLLYFEGLADTADKYWNNNTVYIDGKEVSGDGVHYLHLGSDFALLLYYSAIEENVTAASGFSGVHTLQIKSGTSLANGEYTVAGDVWLKLNGYEVTQLSPVNLTYTGSAVQDWGTRFAFTFSGFADTADKYWNGNTVYIDGKAVSGDGVHYLPDSGDNINLYLYYSAITANAATADALGAHTLEIPAGTLLGNYVVAKSLHFQIDGSSITQVYTPDITVTLNDDWRNDSGCTDGVWFTTSEADALAYDTANWTTKYSMTTGGIYVNDTLVSGAKLVKVTDTLYYTAFDGCGITFAAGDVVKIAGTVTADGYTVAYTETSFQYDGNGAWDIYTAPVGNKFALDESDPGGWQEAASRYLIWLTDDISGDKTELGTVQLLIDGASQNVATALIDGRYALILNADCGVAALGEHSVQITAGQALGEYTAANDAVFYTHENGAIDTVAPSYVTLGLDGGAWQGDLNRYLIWLTDDISGDKSEVGDIAVVIDGESATANTALINGKYAMLLNENCGISALGEHSVQIAAGTQFGNYITKEDLTIYTHADGGVDNVAPRLVTLALDTANPGEWQDNENRYLVWLSDDISGEKSAVYSATILMDGELKNVDAALIEGRYALVLNAGCGITKMGAHTVVIPKNSVFGEYVVAQDATLYTHIDGSISPNPGKNTGIALWNLVLGDQIGVKFYVHTEDPTNTQVCFTVDGAKTIANAEQQGIGGLYVFYADVAAAQMAESIAVEVLVNGEVVDSGNYSVRQYADEILSGSYTDKEKALVKAMLNYGGKAQLYFKYNTSVLANADITVEEAAIPQNVESISVSGSVAGLKFYGSTLVFRSRTALRFYFEGNATDCTFMLGDKELTPVEKDGLWYVEIADINPQDLDQTVTVTVNDTLTVEYSPLDYIVRMNANGSSELAALLKAMYTYHLAAVDYLK